MSQVSAEAEKTRPAEGMTCSQSELVQSTKQCRASSQDCKHVLKLAVNTLYMLGDKL